MIRPATGADLPALYALQSQLDRPSPELLERCVEGVGIVLVSTADGRPVGYLLAIDGPNAIHAAELTVEPDHRREGRASTLLDRLLSRATRTNRNRVTLAVHPENEAARRCYRDLGFEVEERRAEFYGDEPALLMAWTP